MSNSKPDAEDAACDVEDASAVEHVSEIADGCGCVEVWEHLSEQRAAADD